MRQPFDQFIYGNGFGPRVSPTPGASSFHAAQDYGVPRGTPILAIDAGTVSASFRTSAGGFWTFLDLDNGDSFGVCHSDEVSPIVGQHVQRGDEINRSGNSGTATTGPHAHVTIRVRGTYVDPRIYIESRLTAASSIPASTPGKHIRLGDNTVRIVDFVKGGNIIRLAVSDSEPPVALNGYAASYQRTLIKVFGDPIVVDAKDGYDADAFVNLSNDIIAARKRSFPALSRS